MYKVKIVEEVSFAHTVNGDPKCSRMHGHNWKFFIEVGTETLVDGMVINFTTIKNIIRELDHKYVVSKRDVQEMDSKIRVGVKGGDVNRVFDILDKESVVVLDLEYITAELLCKYIYDRIKKIRSDAFVKVTVCETERSCAEYEDYGMSENNNTNTVPKKIGEEKGDKKKTYRRYDYLYKYAVSEVSKTNAEIYQLDNDKIYKIYENTINTGRCPYCNRKINSLTSHLKHSQKCNEKFLSEIIH
jgi:6-pyruvoyl-tetrahydropterin synthase